MSAGKVYTSGSNITIPDHVTVLSGVFSNGYKTERLLVVKLRDIWQLIKFKNATLKTRLFHLQIFFYNQHFRSTFFSSEKTIPSVIKHTKCASCT